MTSDQTATAACNGDADSRAGDSAGLAPGSFRGKPRRPEPTPTQRALALLTRREHSRKELQRKLQARGVSVEQAQQAADALESAGWQSDARFAESLVRARASGGYGPGYIRAELATHGVGAEQIAAALENYEGDWIERAGDLVRRRFSLVGEGDRQARRKAADFLLRRGFSMEQVRGALRVEE